ncbi:LysR family transcriptional regulator [Ruminiclostridium cellulolyticum]|uniref:Transcriptional regulator, LysR family n=2 Tax=Ruminiclostridium cellulolyticum TaxID=1521 RepID=B8I7W2_RUMCH|nr:LysR family transcriptional regulator [Ruminiclostridium cellulolyticum]ABA39421.1 Orf4 [Ruminiclostridium cellulolyticum]ACL75119.1 transcriptional regulator, LysR family [Ruminiclostridium cellulolyticum H10]
MTSQQLEYIIRLADEKSFSKASQKLLISQPALSQFVKNLETELNIQLFDRSTTPIKLTYAGELYVNAARKIQNILTELDNELTDLTVLNIGKLTIGTIPFRASCMLPKSIVAFRKKYPGIDIHIVENEEANLESFLTESRLDLCILSGSLHNKLLQTEILAQEQFYLAVPQDSPFNNGKEAFRISANDIIYDSSSLFLAKSLDLSVCVKEHFVLIQDDETIASKLSQFPEFSRQNAIYTDRIETAFSWTLAGIACSFIPDTLIRFGNYQKHPVYYKLNTSFAKRDILVAYKKNRYLSKAASEYILLLKQLIGCGTWLSPNE